MTSRVVETAGVDRSESDEHLQRNQAGRSSEHDPPLGVPDILDSLPFYVMLVDEDHRILRANKAVSTQLGKDPDAITGGYCPNVIHGLDQPWYACPLEEAVVSGQIVEREAYDQGSGLWFRSSIYPTGRTTPEGKKIFFHMVADVTSRKKTEEQLLASQEELRSLSAYIESVRETERTKIAREVHDELGQILTAMHIDFVWLTKRLPSDHDAIQQKLASMRGLLDSAIQTVKRVALELRPGILDDLGLASAIEWQGQDFEKRTEIKFRFKVVGSKSPLDRDRTTAMFRIFQEALTNVARHANATSVTVTLKRGVRSLRLEIKDNGKGIQDKEVAGPTSFGLMGIKERVRALAGRVSIRGADGKGTMVVVSIPVPVEGNNAQSTGR